MYTLSLLSIFLTIAGTLPCGEIRVNKSNRMRNCTLQRDAIFAGAVIPRNSTVFFKPDGDVSKMFLSRDTAIEGHVCRGGPDAWETGFYPSGHLRLCWLAVQEKIDGIPCRRATILADITGGSVGVWLYEDGHLARCEAAARFVVGSCRVKTGDTVKLDAAGNISVRGVACGVRSIR